jgi:hypothetical protein
MAVPDEERSHPYRINVGKFHGLPWQHFPCQCKSMMLQASNLLELMDSKPKINKQNLVGLCL